MKTKYLLSALTVALMGLTSCSDFLTEDPKGKTTPDGFFSSQANLDASVNALYYNVQQSQCNSNPMIVQCQGDDVTSTTGSNKGAYLSADAFEVPTDEKGLNNLWGWQYNIIQAANLIIDGAPSTPVSQESINEALGQAYFWRAAAYFQLVRVFGPLPVNDHNVPDNNQTDLTSVEGIYQHIIDDLTKAEECNLPARYTATNKAISGMNVFISEQAVKSLLCAVYMNMAGYPLNRTECYDLAAAKAKEVVDGVNSGKYPNQLCADWKDVYSFGNNWSSEAILAIVYKANPGGWSNQDSQLTSCHQLGSLSGWGDFLAERHYWSLFPDGPRKDYVYAKQLRSSYGGVMVDWWATLDGEPFNGETGEGSNAVVSEYRPMFVAFTVNADAAGKQPLAESYDPAKPFWGGMCLYKTHQLIRYSEVICWFAEATSRGSGTYKAQALQELQKVQARAYAAGATPDNSDLAESAYREHGYEVAGLAYALVTRRADEFRMNRLQEAFDYRKGPQSAVLVPAGTPTHSVRADGTPFTYNLKQDLVLKENMPVTASWQGEKSIYQIYPTVETEKNPKLVR